MFSLDSFREKVVTLGTWGGPFHFLYTGWVLDSLNKTKTFFKYFFYLAYKKINFQKFILLNISIWVTLSAQDTFSNLFSNLYTHSSNACCSLLISSLISGQHSIPYRSIEHLISRIFKFMVRSRLQSIFFLITCGVCRVF